MTNHGLLTYIYIYIYLSFARLSADAAEALAVLQGSKLAGRMHWKRVLVETDSELTFKSLMRNEESQRWQTEGIVEEIIKREEDFELLQIRWIKRQANKMYKSYCTLAQEEGPGVYSLGMMCRILV